MQWKGILERELNHHVRPSIARSHAFQTLKLVCGLKHDLTPDEVQHPKWTTF